MNVLATNTIEKICWMHYQDIEDRKYYYPLTIMITVPCALTVFFAFEAYKVPLVLFLLRLPNQYHSKGNNKLPNYVLL
jgi:hypothetical protein